MCLAIAKGKNRVLDRGMLERAFEANSDGCGFAYARKGKLIVRKGFFDFKKFWASFSRIQKGNPAILHFRNATIGAKNEANCHPFLINENLAVAHNGVLSNWQPTKGKKSDTACFVTAILKPLHEKVPDAYLDIVLQCLLEAEIGSGNKMAFLDSRGRCSILRKWAGFTHEGCWYSNDSFKKFEIEEQEQKQQKDYKPFKPTNQTEQILGGKSRLGEINKHADGGILAGAEEMMKKRYRSGSTKGAPDSRFFRNETERDYFNAMQRGIGRRGFTHLFEEEDMIGLSELAGRNFRDMIK